MIQAASKKIQGSSTNRLPLILDTRYPILVRMDAVEEIKERLAIEDVIGEYLQLKRAGSNLKAISPFTNEKTPSFIVSPEKQIWHDFSSGKGGNMFTFVMEMEGLDFKGALEFLARKAGVDLVKYQRSGSAEREEQKKRLFELLELATKFYQVQFKQSNQALTYVFKNRGFNKDTALKFRLGYAPDSKADLCNFLASKGFTLAQTQAAGLAARGKRDAVDMFRGRLMIPLMDPFGRTIGFTARLLVDRKDAPKYINTPQTLLYDKSRHVFGLHLAKESIRMNKFVVAAEGNLDVMSSHQANVANVVASAGTAMTEQHLKALSRLTNDVRLAFDQDDAGRAATERVIPLAAKTGVNLSIVYIGGSKDPDELIRKDAKAWAKAVNEPVYALDWLIDYYKNRLDIKTAQGKKQFSDTILAVIKKLSDSVEQEHYLRQVADTLGVSLAALQPKMDSPGTPATFKKVSRDLSHDIDALHETKKTQNQLLSLALFNTSVRDVLASVETEMLIEEPARKVLSFLKEHLDFSGNVAAQPELKRITDYVKMLSLQFEELYGAIEDKELHYEAARLRNRLIEQYVRNRKTELSKRLETTSDPETKSLLEEAKKLDKLLNLTRE